MVNASVHLLVLTGLISNSIMAWLAENVSSSLFFFELVYLRHKNDAVMLVSYCNVNCRGSSSDGQEDSFCFARPHG